MQCFFQALNLKKAISVEPSCCKASYSYSLCQQHMSCMTAVCFAISKCNGLLFSMHLQFCTKAEKPPPTKTKTPHRLETKQSCVTQGPFSKAIKPRQNCELESKRKCPIDIMSFGAGLERRRQEKHIQPPK